jgi:hypothetical protein
MAKGAPLRWIENRCLGRHLHGHGIEIGALWRRFPVPQNARVWYIDRSNPDGLEKQYPGVSGKVVCPNLLADATQLPFALPLSISSLLAMSLNTCHSPSWRCGFGSTPGGLALL